MRLGRNKIMAKEDAFPTPLSLNVHVNLRYGPGASHALFDLIKERGYKNIGLVLDVGLLGNQHFVEFRRRLTEEFPVTHEHVNKEMGPTYDYLDQTVDAFRGKNIDLVVAVGGGSTLDIGKAIAVLLTNPGLAITYRGVNKIKNASVPFVMIPTTAGTGSEVIPNAPMVDTKEKRKQGISTSFYHPELVILDPLFTVSCPRNVTIAAAMDALLHHAVDAYISNEKNELCSFFAKEAVRQILRALPEVVEYPENVEMRGALQLGALYAGIALSNGGGGSIAGAASYPLEVSFHIPHGMGVAITGLEAVRFNIEKGYEGYGFFSDAIPGVKDGTDMGMKERADLFYEHLKKLYQNLGIPRLSKYGVEDTHLSDLAEEISGMPVANKNPITINAGDMRAILAVCL